MAVDWDDIQEKVGEQLTTLGASGQADALLVKSIETPHGGKKEMRSFDELAKIQTIAKNQAAASDMDSNGIMSRVEMDPLS